jgi:hypothetical protein
MSVAVTYHAWKAWVDSRPARTIAASLLAAALIVIVALGSRAVAPRPGEPAVRSLRVPPSLTEYLLLLIAPVALAGIVGFALVMAPAFRRRKREDEELMSPQPPAPGWGQALILAVAVAAIAMPVALAVWASGQNADGSSGSGAVPSARAAPSIPGSSGASQPEPPTWGWTPVAVVAAGASASLIGLAVARRRVAVAGTPERSAAAALRRTMLDSIEDLRAEPDARRAVIAAYARMEQDLSSHGLPRRRWEAPLEYLDRALVQLDVDPVSASRLTVLFESAKFGHHPVDDGMRAEAIAALERIAGDLAEVER